MTTDERYSIEVGRESEPRTDHWLRIIEALSHLDSWQIRVQALHGPSIVVVAIDDAAQNAIAGALVFDLAVPTPCHVRFWLAVCLLILLFIGTAYLERLTLRFQ